MLWDILYSCLVLFVSLPTLLVFFIAHRVAKPPWHRPNPGKVHSEDNLPVSWAGATSPSQLHLKYLDVTFLSHANLTLRAWLIPSRSASSIDSRFQTPAYHSANEASGEEDANASEYSPSRVAVVCVHGAGRDRRAFLRHSSFLSHAGYDVLLFDCGNHGTSDCVPVWPFSPWPGRAVSLGRREYQDVNAAVTYLLRRGAEKVIILGTSQGASSAVIAAAKQRNVALLILENAFVSPDALIGGIVDVVLSRIGITILKTLLKPPIVWLSLLRTGNLPRSSQLRAVDFIAQVEAPILFVHGTNDILVSFKQSEQLFQMVAHERKDLWIVEGAAHTQCWFKESEQFETRVLGFIREHLGENKT